MSLPPSRTVPPSFVRPNYSRVSLHLKRDDGDDSDDDDDDDDHSNSSTHSKSPQSTHSQSSQNGDGASQNDSNQITSSKTNAGAIAGGVIAGIIALAVLAFFWWKRRSFRRNRPNVKIEIDPTSALNGEAYLEPQTRGIPKDEEQSLMYERTSTVDADTNPRPSQPQFWRVYNVSESDDVSDAPIARNIHGVREKDIGERHLKGTSGDGTSSANIIPVPEKDFGYTATGTSASKAGLRSSYTSVGSTKSRTEKDSTNTYTTTLYDSVGPSSWKHQESMGYGKGLYSGSEEGENVSQTSASGPSRRFSEPEANDLALAAREEVLDLRRRVELLKEENAELTRRESARGSFERLPAYVE
ncbi:hypothetical protein EV361DRAFT_944161 [Lentinula raphanica]|uniref:Uncharacterized protein n=1 Tax=Lentinula raphanica TaxID=153919 RepID=A0AA38UA68_9AGAR|nr:hypothetical protein F5878DRAFT_728038 [Lentinula raphanica]KAJ3977649.1 hypothetical protein EV361DRAFT_944161 [Lentinula raphanica]